MDGFRKVNACFFLYYSSFDYFCLLLSFNFPQHPSRWITLFWLFTQNLISFILNTTTVSYFTEAKLIINYFKGFHILFISLFLHLILKNSLINIYSITHSFLGDAKLVSLNSQLIFPFNSIFIQFCIFCLLFFHFVFYFVFCLSSIFIFRNYKSYDFSYYEYLV